MSRGYCRYSPVAEAWGTRGGWRRLRLQREGARQMGRGTKIRHRRFGLRVGSQLLRRVLLFGGEAQHASDCQELWYDIAPCPPCASSIICKRGVMLATHQGFVRFDINSNTVLLDGCVNAVSSRIIPSSSSGKTGLTFTAMVVQSWAQLAYDVASRLAIYPIWTKG